MNKNLSALALVISLAALGLVLWHMPTGPGAAQKESAYARVMRTRTLRCGYALWPSETEMDPNTKQLKGLVPDFAKALGEKLGLKIEWTEELLWGQQTEALKTGKIDAICASDGPWVTSGAAFVDYAEPMLYIPIYVYGREGETRFKTLSDLNKGNITISTMDGDISLSLALEKFPQAKRLELTQSADPALTVMNVMTGKADLALMSPQTDETVNKNSATKLVKIFDEPLAIVNSSFSVAKGETELLQLLNQGFRILHQFGVSDTIVDRFDPEHKLVLRAARGWR
ncbi:MAG: transporter substrate-binding domain-containing protein [Alphaproteobacteria bacterium]|nr:transporter substrate-binding domain-containing protein [Alphaproteobacteria bacterium]